MRKITAILLFVILVGSLHSKLHIRNNYFNNRVARMSYRGGMQECCSDQAEWHNPTSQVDAEDEVNRLRMQNINDYDNGIYLATWQKRRSKLLDMQTKLGYTVPERYTWGW